MPKNVTTWFMDDTLYGKRSCPETINSNHLDGKDRGQNLKVEFLLLKYVYSRPQQGRLSQNNEPLSYFIFGMRVSKIHPIAQLPKAQFTFKIDFPISKSSGKIL